MPLPQSFRLAKIPVQIRLNGDSTPTSVNCFKIIDHEALQVGDLWNFKTVLKQNISKMLFINYNTTVSISS